MRLPWQAIILGGLADVALLVATTREGFDYVDGIFATIPVLVFLWVALWLLWQIALLAGLLRGTLCSRSNNGDSDERQ